MRTILLHRLLILIQITFAIGISFMISPLVSAESKQARYCTSERVFAHVSKQSSYPDALKHGDISARIRLYVRPDGAVGRVTFDQRSGHPDLDAAAAKIFAQWRFPTPTRCDVVLVPITFTVNP
jgi:TonB family protein